MKDPVFERWWPLPQSFTFLRAPLDQVSIVLERLFRRPHRQAFRSDRVSFSSIDAFFGSIDTLANIPRTYFALPTRSDWTAIWDDSLQSDQGLGCRAALRHGIVALRFTCSDASGTTFRWSEPTPGGLRERSLFCCPDGGRWVFHAQGEPLPGEPIERYGRRLRRERMNEEVFAQFLHSLGIDAWREAFYDLSARPAFRLEPLGWAPAAVEVPVSRILGPQPAPLASDELVEGPPSYLRGRNLEAEPGGPVRHLPEHMARYDLVDGARREFTIHLPVDEDERPPVVRAFAGSLSDPPLLVYDPRAHPASPFAGRADEAAARPFGCPTCGGRAFRVAVAFEYPADAGDPDDTSWFSLALACVACGWSGLAWEDETA